MIDFKKLTKPYQNDLAAAIKHFVAIPSVLDLTTKSESTPYGIHIDKALKEFAKLGDMYGFDVDLDSHYCELSIGNEGPLIEVFGHLDVVPVTDNSLFTVREDEDNYYGRGVADDKGPLLAALYAVKALKDNGLIKNYRIKIFAGSDEENGSSGLDFYIKEKKKEIPEFGFTPDSSFPVVHGEKGGGKLSLVKKIKFDHIISIKGGIAGNIVMPECTFKVDNIDEIKNQLTDKAIIKGDEITFIGKSAHGASPFNGINAFLLGANTLGKIYKDNFLIKLYEKFIDYTGKAMGADAYSKYLKSTTYSIGIVEYKNEELKIEVDARYPETTTFKIMGENVSKAVNMEIVKDTHASNPLLIDPKSKLVTSLLDAYNAETNSNLKPITSGGGTYAKHVKNTLAFGAQPPGIDYFMHSIKEFIPKKDLVNAMSIYAHAIYNLMNRK